jgi:hypothetical protein
MKPGRTEPLADRASGPPQAGSEASTGLPWPRSWPGVYWVVVGSFVLYVLLLVLLTAKFS